MHKKEKFENGKIGTKFGFKDDQKETTLYLVSTFDYKNDDNKKKTVLLGLEEWEFNISLNCFIELTLNILH